MKIIKPSSEYLDRNIHPYKLIERIGRTCYKSEDKITEDSAVRFVKAMVTNKHYAMLEHGQIYIKLNGLAVSSIKCAYNNPDRVNALRYMTITKDLNIESDDIAQSCSILSGSFRAYIEMIEYFKTLIPYYEKDYDVAVVIQLNNYLSKIYPEVFEYIPNIPETYTFNLMTMKDVIRTINVYSSLLEDEKDELLKELVIHTVKFTCDRGVSHEFVRHRPCSFAQESTRYCNYNKDQFGAEITVIQPFYFVDREDDYEYKVWKEDCETAETAYINMINWGATPQEARAVLPNSLKTELVITANEKEWQHIINLRYHGITGKPHPQMHEAMETIYDKLLSESNNRLH